MRVGLDGLALGGERDGSWVYFTELVRHVAAVDQENTYTIFVQNAIRHALPSGEAIAWQLEQRLPGIPRALYHQYYYARTKALGNLDILHTAAFISPVFVRAPVAQVLTLHDLSFLSYPQTMKWTGRWWWRLLAPTSIRHAACIVASSEATRAQIKKHFVFPEEKIKVVYPCVRDGLSRVEDARSRLAQYNLPSKYILFVGTLEPRKNLMNLVRAFALAKRQAKLDHALVLAGARGWDFDRLASTIEQSGFSEQIILPGRIADKDLSALYSAADLFTLVSWHEGFGFPIIEAMACGVPVIASNVSSLPEVLGDAGILVEPNNPEEIATQIVRVLTDRDLAQDMVIRGQSRVKLFSAERFRQGILEVYRQTKLALC